MCGPEALGQRRDRAHAIVRDEHGSFGSDSGQCDRDGPITPAGEATDDEPPDRRQLACKDDRVDRLEGGDGHGMPHLFDAVLGEHLLIGEVLDRLAGQ